MIQESSARATDIAPELLREADACRHVNTNLAGKLEEMAEEVSRVQTCVQQFATAKTIADLLGAYQTYEFAYSDKFHLILGGFWTDALRSGNPQTIEGLRRGLKLLRDVNVALHEITHAKEEEEADTWAERLLRNPLACDTHFHEFLDGRARFAGKLHHASAEGFAKLATHLRHFCKTTKALAKAADAPRSVDGYKTVTLPSSAEQAELWFFFSQQFSEQSLELAAKINETTLSLQDALAAIVDYGIAVATQSPYPGNDNDETTRTFLASAFLEHLLMAGSSESRIFALDQYRDLLSTGHWSSEAAQATFVLRYAKAVLNYWRYVSDQRERLQEAADAIRSTLPSVDIARLPRLTRDLWIVRARLLENVGIWNPEVYEDAADAYHEGLTVANIKFELEARGRALTDYANTLSRLHRDDQVALDRKIISTFEEALTVFRTEESILGGTLARNSYAVYLNERMFGNRIENQEKALALVQEAIGIIEGDNEEYDPNNDYLSRVVAGPYLTMSNIVLQREVGDQRSAHETAIKALHSAWDKLGKAQDDLLRGIVKLDVGHAEIALYGMTGDEANARNAMYAYQEAEGLLRPYPHEYSQAILGTAMLVSEVPGYSTPEAVKESLASAKQALELVRQAHDRGAEARAKACLAELLLLRNHAGDHSEAVGYLLQSCDTFYAIGATENAISASQRISSVQMRLHRETSSPEAIMSAKEALSVAAGWVDELWAQFDSVDWHYLISDRYSEIYADIAWCQATLHEPLRDLLSTLARSKGREFVAHAQELQLGSQSGETLREYADQLRVDSRLAERKRWQAAREAKPDVPLDEVMRTSREAMRNIELARRVIFPRPSAENEAPVLDTVSAFLETHSKTIILDITLSRWGTVAVLFGGKDTAWAASPQVLTLPLTTSKMLQPVRDWLSSYFSYLKASAHDRATPRKDWAATADRLLDLLGPALMQPCLDKLADDATEFTLLIAGGRLAGLPLHATRLKNGRYVIETLATVEYLPNISVLSPKAEQPVATTSALCVVSDPFGDLPSTIAECKDVADFLMQLGAKVSILARSGKELGTAAFAQRGVAVISGAEVLDTNPTPTRVAELLADKDHFFYSGHGTRSRGQSGLVLVGDDGKEVLLSEDEILSMPALRTKPLIVLSACETARSEQGSSELFDVASCFLRIGARYVVGSLWVVRGDFATAFTASFYRQLAAGVLPSRAYGDSIRELLRFQPAGSGANAIPPDHPIYWAPFIALRGE
jgi:CHAT domain-containing protein